MIILRAIESDEFSDYEEIFLADYGKDLQVNHGRSAEESLRIAETALSNSFPKKISESTEILQCIEDEGTIVGYLWHSLDHQHARAFISDIFIHESYRNLGYGKQAITALELTLSREKIDALNLRVAYDNPRALQLYKRIGFNITGTNMSKKIR